MAAARFSFGDVVLVPFPFTDQTGAKKRPAVVVSSSGYNTGLVKASVIKPVFATIEPKVALITGVTGQDGGLPGRVPIEEGLRSARHQARTRTTTETSRSLPTS